METQHIEPTSRLAELVAEACPSPNAPTGDLNAVLADAAANGWLDNLTRLLASEVNATSPAALPPLGFDPASDTVVCPGCGSTDLAFCDTVLRWWRCNYVTDGVMFFDGTYEVDDAGDREHVACFSCSKEWAAPDADHYDWG